MDFETKFETKIENLNKDEKVERWRQTEQEVRLIKDKLSKDIDEEIKPAVIALKASGFGTTGSCEGHLDRALPWPWVEVESPLAEKLLTDAHFNELKEKARAWRKGQGLMTDTEKIEHDEFINAQIKENEKSYQRLTNLLGEFYENNPENVFKNFTPLVIEKGPWNQGRLQPKNAPKGMKAPEIQKLWNDEEKAERLKLCRLEMERFASFLKDKFFRGEV